MAWGQGKVCGFAQQKKGKGVQAGDTAWAKAWQVTRLSTICPEESTAPVLELRWGVGVGTVQR